LPPSLLHSSAHRRALHSFPTRRSSDLITVRAGWPLPPQNKRNPPQHNKRHHQPCHIWRHTGAICQAARTLGRAPRLFAAEKAVRSEEHTSELQSRENLVCRLLLEKKKT